MPEELKWFAVLARLRSSEVTADLTRRHVAFTRALEASGIVLGAGPLQWSGERRLRIVRARSVEEVEQLMADDPYAMAGLLELDVYEWSVAAETSRRLDSSLRRPARNQTRDARSPGPQGSR